MAPPDPWPRRSCMWELKVSRALTECISVEQCRCRLPRFLALFCGLASFKRPIKDSDIYDIFFLDTKPDEEPERALSELRIPHQDLS